ncbi:hypothetical protein [Hydrogenophilus thiooxidans]|uniref:hypothetical protein n=1 Tax=Hydrogenophilus thiooxidans TaxID=2820326 RepID=UPI001C24EDAB|nr:hypothetical protein [Hydrogenophilus thiooxidans]
MFFDPPPSREPALWERHLFGTAGIVLLFSVYLLLGQFHAPWLGEDLRHFLPAWRVFQGQVIPTSLSHPDLTPWGPLYAWSAAILGSITQALGFPFHDGSRLATPLWLALQTGLLASAVKRLQGKPGAIVAAIAALSPLGWLVFAHVHTSVVAASACIALLLWATTVFATRRDRLIGWFLGTLLLFWSSGLPGVILALGALPLVYWRSATFPRASAWSFLFAPPDVAPSHAVPHSAPLGVSFRLWAVAALLAGIATVGFVLGDPSVQAWARTTLLPFSTTPEFEGLLSRGGWTLWPLWLVAFWPIRCYELWRVPEIRPVFLWLLWMIAGTLTCFPVSESTYLILSPLLAYVAALRLVRFGPSTTAAFAWFSLAMTVVLVVLVAAMLCAQLFSWPPGLARHIARATPEFALDAAPVRLATAAIGLLLWALLVWRLPRQAVRAAAHWLLSVVLLWWLTVSLLYPWLDAARNLEPTVRALWHNPVVAAHRCLAPGPHGGADLIAALQYTAPPTATVASDCPLVALRLRVRDRTPQALAEWRRWVVADATRGRGKLAEWWVVVPRGAPPLTTLGDE